ncbi:receptor-like protein EIX2 [Cornus florida]|uniref:receptor-like protein EIX2 n=1 Tax=Cornus florida TaxID=4283 RepID=UPI002897DEB3|nr:receptor-like protein EIX2 [Cornus florida]
MHSSSSINYVGHLYYLTICLKLLSIDFVNKLIKDISIVVVGNALLTFKQGLKDPSGRLSSWKGDDCCRWSGVRCNNISRHVVKLHLRNPISVPIIKDFALLWGDGAIDSMEYDQQMAYESLYTSSRLGGKISSSLLHLTYLNSLDLSSNDFKGIRIPKFLGMLKNLRYLNLSSSLFFGEIPPHLGNLSSLIYLDLSRNSVVSGNLKWLSRLSSLKYLNLGEVEVSDTNWLQSINMLPNLVELHLSGCYLPSLPLSLPFVNSTLLSVLDISGGLGLYSMPNWLFNLTSLTEFYLSDNFFGDPIPSEFVKLKSLESLDLSYNNFKGQLPIFLGNLCKLKVLDLSDNNFTGEVVEFFGGFLGCPTNSLVSLNLEYNSLEGELPKSIGMLKNLQHLYLFNNSFSGS